jgi:hypothetical protein
LEEFVVERLLQHKPDAALGVGDDQVQRGRMHLSGSELVAPQNEADLGPIAVGDNYSPPRFDHIGDVAGGLAHRIPLVDDLGLATVCNQ